MITNRTYLNYIKQIALLFCNNDNLCGAGVESRLNKYLTNETFESFLATLNNRKWYAGYFNLPMVWNPVLKLYQTRFNYTEILSGTSGFSSPVNLPASIYDQNNTDWKKVIEYVNKPYLKFENIISDRIIFSSNEHSGYGIAFTTSTPGTATSGTTTSGTQGTITVQTPAGQAQVNAQTGQVTATQNFKLSDFDFKNLIVPGLIVLGFLLARKYKVI